MLEQIERDKCTDINGGPFVRCRERDPILTTFQDCFHERAQNRSICKKMTNKTGETESGRLGHKRNGRFSDQGEQHKAEGGSDRPILNHRRISGICFPQFFPVSRYGKTAYATKSRTVYLFRRFHFISHECLQIYNAPS